MNDFSSLGLSLSLLKSLERLNFTTPTPIQQAAIPAALQGSDILGSAQTGTGKTGAFGIPLAEHILQDANNQALVITPTRELAYQVSKAVTSFLPPKFRREICLLIGGEPIGKQLAALRHKPRIIVGTPGRITDHLQRRTLQLQATNFLVLDETDRMLDMGFTEDINKIVAKLAQPRQTLLFSATMPTEIEKIAQKYLIDPVRVCITPEKTTPEKIDHNVVYMSEQEKYSSLLDELDQREGSVIVFVKTKMSAAKMALNLRKENHFADAMHGDLRQNKRDRVIKNFRNQKYRIMVATDIAARGLDIPHIEHVINYDLPQCPEDYIHRIGRTGRANKSGQALCFVTPREKGKWREIDYLMHPEKAEQAKKDRSSHQTSRKNSSKSSKFGKKRSFSHSRGKTSSSEGRSSRYDRDTNGQPSRFGKKRRFSKPRKNHDRSTSRPTAQA